MTGTLTFWIPDGLLTVFVCLFWAEDLRFACSQHKRLRPTFLFAFYLAVLSGVLLVALCELLVCLKADGMLESTPYLLIFAPGIAGVLLLFVSGVGCLIGRLQLDRDVLSEVRKQQNQEERERLNDILQRFAADHLSPELPPLSRDLSNLLSNGYAPDLTIIVQQQPIFVHEAILHVRRRVWDVLSDLHSGLIPNEFNEGTKSFTITLKSLSYNQLYAALNFLYSADPRKEGAFLAVQRLYLHRRVTLDVLKPGRLARDYARLLSPKCSSFSDVTWLAEDGVEGRVRLKLHKFFLSCRSRFFYAMFKCAFSALSPFRVLPCAHYVCWWFSQLFSLFSVGLRESRTDENSLPADTSYPIFYQLIQTIYTGRLTVSYSDLLVYLEVAHRYQVDDALRLAQRELFSAVSPVTLVDMFSVADLMDLEPLRHFCVCFCIIFWDVLEIEGIIVPATLSSEAARLRDAGCTLDSPREIERTIQILFPKPALSDSEVLSSESLSESPQAWRQSNDVEPDM